MIRRLKLRKGATFKELVYGMPIPEEYSGTDAGPEAWVMNDLESLLDLGLIEAFKGGKQLRTPRSWGLDGVKFYIAPLAVEIEELLHVDLTAGIRPSFWRFPPTPLPSAPEVFVLMPFSQAMQPIFDDHIKVVCTGLGLRAQRSDDFFNANVIVEDIWRAIYYAQVIIADCSGRNPNVFYEAGLAHALGRTTVLITQSLDDVPFDLRHLRVIRYAYTPPGMKEFEEDLSSTLSRWSR
jgi:hypothetical protein